MACDHYSYVLQLIWSSYLCFTINLVIYSNGLGTEHAQVCCNGQVFSVQPVNSGHGCFKQYDYDVIA